MKYYPKGWNTYKFMITPNEFKDIFGCFHHVEFCRRVPENYIESDPKILFDKYKIFYEKLISNHKFVKEIDYQILDILDGLTNNLSKCTYAEKFMDQKNKQWYKTSDFTEPCVGLNIFIFLLDKNNKLSLSTD